MRRELPYSFVFLGTLICALAPVASAADQLTFGTGVGTLGTALTIAKNVDRKTAVRITYGTFAFRRDAQFDNVVIDVLTRLRLTEQFHVQSVGLYVDRLIRPTIHVSIGAIFNQNRIGAVSVPADSSIVIGNYVYSAAQAGQVFTDVKWMPVSPYIGIGFGPRRSDRRRLALVAEVGAYYEGPASVSFATNGEIEANQILFAKYFATLKGQLSRELSPVQVYPVIQLGIRLRM